VLDYVYDLVYMCYMFYAKIRFNMGLHVFLWHDLWSDQILEQAFPELFSYAKNSQISVSQACQS